MKAEKDSKIVDSLLHYVLNLKSVWHHVSVILIRIGGCTVTYFYFCPQCVNGFS